MATLTVGTHSNRDGGPQVITGYFTANGTTTAETVDLSTYGTTIKFASCTSEHNVSTTPAFIKAVSYTGSTLTITHDTPTTTSLVIRVYAELY